jgi:hypothetical protein
MWPGQAGRPKGGGREAWTGVPAPTWTLAGPGPVTLTGLSSLILQLFPFPSLPATQRKRWGEWQRCGFVSRNLYILFKKASKPGKAWDKPS